MDDRWDFPTANLVAALVARVAEVAQADGRTDLAEEMQDAAAGLENVVVPVALIGPSDSGKSTLFNSLLNASLSPVDPVGATAVPVMARAGLGQTRALLFIGADDDLDLEPIAPDELPQILVRRLEDPQPDGLAAVQFHVDRLLLRQGVLLIDVPSLQARGRSLSRAAFDLLGDTAVVLVLDASHELDRPWIEFLADRQAAGQRSMVVFTKVDISPHWREVSSKAISVLGDRGWDIPVLCVSCELRRHALGTGDGALNRRSGVPTLVSILLKRAVEPHRARILIDVVIRAERALAEMTASLRLSSGLSASGRSADADLEALSIRYQRLQGARAELPRRLQERLERLQFEFETLATRALRDVGEVATRYIDSHDPSAVWSELTAVIEEEVETAAGQVFTFLEAELADTRSEMMEIIGSELDKLIVDLDDRVLHGAAQQVRLERFKGTRSRTYELGVDAVRGSAGASAIAHLLLVPLNAIGASTVMLLPFTAAFTLLLGRRSLRMAKENQVTNLRRAAHQHFAKYFSDLQSEFMTEARRVMSTTRHRVRESIELQVNQLGRALEADMKALRQADQVAISDTEQRRAETTEQLARLAALEKAAAQLHFRLDRAAA